MKISTLAVCLVAACLAASTAGAKVVPVGFASRTIVCRTPDILFVFGTTGVGGMTISTAGDILLTAGPRGASVETACKRLRVRTQPKPVLPRPSFLGGGSYDCTTPGTVVLHVQYLRSGGRVTGIYVSARVRRTGRFIAAAIVTNRGIERGFLGSTCVA